MIEEIVSPLVATGDWIATSTYTWWSLTSWVLDTLNPELIVNVQHIGSWNSVAWFLAQYIPSLWNYSDVEIFSFGFIAFLRILCVIWVLRDAVARSNSVFYQIFSSLLVVFLTPIFGLPLYLAFRPLVYKWERRAWREALEETIVSCPNCQNLNADAHIMCVWCGEPLKVECKQCHEMFHSHFAYCPICWAPHLD